MAANKDERFYCFSLVFVVAIVGSNQQQIQQIPIVARNNTKSQYNAYTILVYVLFSGEHSWRWCFTVG